MASAKAFRAVTLLLLAALTGCGTMKPEQFADTEPKFRVEEYFLGKTRGWGIFEDRFGDLRRQFVVDINGAWQGDVFVMEERFLYSDGETDERVWRISKQGDGRYQGRAGDVVGVAEGIAAGNALNWRYAMDLKVGDGTWRVKFDDWMFLQPDGVLMNRARVTKWGIAVGEVTLMFQRWPRQDQAAAPAGRDLAAEAALVNWPRAVAE
jgi:hypothetical protein